MEFVRADPAAERRRVNLSTLPAGRKRAAWERLKRERPAVAERIRSEGFQALLKRFGGYVILDGDD